MRTSTLLIVAIVLTATPLLASAALRSTTAATTSATVAAPRALQEEVCTFDVTVAECTVSALRDAVDNDGCDFGSSDFRKSLRRACGQARRIADRGTPLEDLIDEFDTQDLENFFNGGTYWNENTGDVVDEAPIISEIFEDTAQSATIRYPRNLETFANCELGAAVCLWVRDRQADDDNGNCARPLRRNCVDADPADNTDLCYADASRLPSASHVAAGRALFPGDLEGDVHAHGFAWKRGSLSNRFKGNLLFYISMKDHLNDRGYAEAAPLSPMCGCIEHMPTISRADCTEVAVEEEYRVTYDGSAEVPASAERTSVDIEFNACDGETANDLYSEMAQLYAEDLPEEDVRTYLTGPEDNNDPSNCPSALPEE